MLRKVWFKFIYFWNEDFVCIYGFLVVGSVYRYVLIVIYNVVYGIICIMFNIEVWSKVLKIFFFF